MKKCLTIITLFISLSGYTQVFDIPKSESLDLEVGFSAAVGPSKYGTMTQYGVYKFDGRIYKGLFITTSQMKSEFGAIDFKYGYVFETKHLEKFKFIPGTGVGLMATKLLGQSVASFDVLASLTIHYHVYSGLSFGMYIDSHYFTSKYTFGGILATVYIK